MATKTHKPKLTPQERAVLQKYGGYYKPIISVIPPHKTFYVYIRDKEK